MNFRFTIGKKIALGFGVIVFLTIVSFYFTNYTLKNSREKTREVIETYNPSVDALKELDNFLYKTRLGINEWTSLFKEDLPQKRELTRLINIEYPALKAKIVQYSTKWKDGEQESIRAIFTLLDHLIEYYKEQIMMPLTTFDDHNDPLIKFMADQALEDSYSDYLPITLKLKS